MLLHYLVFVNLKKFTRKLLDEIPVATAIET